MTNKTPKLGFVQSQRKFFDILEEFFKRASGGGIEKVPSTTSFGDWVHGNAERLAARGHKAFPWIYDTLIKFYEESRKQLFFSQLKHLGGMKLVLGGTSRFTLSCLDSVRKMLLYGDTILVPDPILPWVEIPRTEERFQNVLFWEQVFNLLHLKTLIDTDLEYPAIAIFPSWEKSLELQDSQTQESQQCLITAVLSRASGYSFGSYKELESFVHQRPDDFLNIVEQNRLFVGPHGNVGDPLSTSIQLYKDSIRTWRSEDHQKLLLEMTDASLVLVALSERISPFYHLFENAEELIANPMFSLPVHWYYYNLCAIYFQERLERLSLLDARSLAEVRAMDADQLKWLGDIPISTIVELRKRGENGQFRSRLRQYSMRLHETSLGDLNRVASEFSRGIASLVIEHQNEILRIQEKYKRKNIHTALLAGITTAATFLPSLAPFLGGTALLAPIGKFSWDLISKTLEKKQISHSLIGILAAAKSKHEGSAQ